LFSYTYALFCAFLQSGKNQLFSFHAIPHSLQKKKTPAGGSRLAVLIPGSSFNLQLSIEDPDSVGTVDLSRVISHGSWNTGHGSRIANRESPACLDFVGATSC